VAGLVVEARFTFSRGWAGMALFDRLQAEIAKRDQRRSVPSGELLEKAIHALAKSLGVKVANG